MQSLFASALLTFAVAAEPQVITQVIHKKQTKPVTELQKIGYEIIMEKVMSGNPEEHKILQAQADLKGEINFDLKNNSNFSYTGNVFVGSPTQGSYASEFVYDTGSGFLTVAASTCSTCTDPYYNPAASSTSVQGYTGYTNTELDYGSAQLKGQMYTDTMCTDAGQIDSCATGFGFFLVESQKGLDGLDGILGFSPAVAGNGPSYIATLFGNGTIPEESVCFNLNLMTSSGPNTASTVQIGGEDSSLYRGDWTDHLIQSTHKTWWTTSLTAIGIGANILPASDLGSVQLAIMDTGTSLMYLPYKAYEKFIDTFTGVDGFTCPTNSWCYSVSKTCEEIIADPESPLADLKIGIDATLYVIPPQGYTFSPGRGYFQKCIIPVMATGRLQNMVIMGDTFLRNFYSKYNYATNTVSLAVSNTVAWNPSIIQPTAEDSLFNQLYAQKMAEDVEFLQ